MATNDTVQLAVKGTVIGQQHVHTLHFRQTAPTSTLQALIDAWQANARTNYRALFHTADSPCQQYTARYVCGSVPLPAPVEETESAGNILGTDAGAGEPMPPYVAEVVSVRTASAGRRRRGRFYIGGLYETQQNGGVALQTYLDAVQLYVNNLVSAVFIGGGASSGWALVVHSPTLAAIPNTQCFDSSTLVTGMIVRSQLGTMRSRKAGSGI